MTDNRIIVELTDGAVNFIGRHNGAFWGASHKIADGRLPAEVLKRMAAPAPGQRPDLVLVLPRRQVILKYLSLPSQEPDELRRIADLRLRQGLPFPREGAVCGVHIGETGQDGYTRVVAAIVRQETVEQCLALLQKFSLSPCYCAVSGFGVAAWHAHRFPSEKDATVLVADGGNDGVELCFCRNGELLYARSLTFGNTPADPEEARRQVRLTLRAFKREYGAQVNKIILTGALREDGFLDGIFQDLSLPLEQAPMDEGPPRAGFTALYGLALADDAGPDLTPSSLLAARSRRARNMAMARLGLAVSFMAAALALGPGLEAYRYGRNLAALRQQIEATRKEAQEARLKVKFLEFIRDNAANQVLVADLFKELYKIVPPHTALSSVELSEGSLVIRGQSKENADANQVQKNMMDSPLFHDVTLQYANRSQGQLYDYTEFEIACKLKRREETS